ncbi:SMP-30/gluconolactonase/LRE family protein [Phaeobacter sp. HF9A]|uniref:SMP-30/gluconolactonase/LRE family protein n=1 Tax=Phaeobacter sp. HF9A TaxID=2721561 RepID=UPI00143188F9|nr:SMP-30/gluconolactonase/LRE family protein [Phaeobacter sp. HF9A]NIZ11875.1 SMP-30/gluconolactonase/LRE family protein [Phaeobacter sp. HF9A]
MSSPEVFSNTRCELGEGALWHPLRQQFFWFDILGKRLLTVEDGNERIWQFDECVSAAGWVDQDSLIMASETGLWRFDLKTGARDLLCPLEADNPVTRSNDGRADPWGGFWIGTMGFDAEPGAGAIYRYFRGELRVVVPDVTISNAICFAPDKSCAYYTDTADGKIMRQPLAAADGWPEGQAEVFVDLSAEEFGPDGAVVDAAGNLWNAQWGAGRVACYSPKGALLETVSLPTPQTSCPAFGGETLETLFVTTAAVGDLPAPAGQTFAIAGVAVGQREHPVIL